MNLSVPIYRLKREARLLAREQHLPLHAALDRLARREGFAAWSLLAARHAAESPAERLLGRLKGGDLLLVTARPGQGKTAFALELVASAARQGRNGMVFSLDYTVADVLGQLQDLGFDPAGLDDRLGIDCSGAISADYIVEQLASAPAGTVIAVDYLQLLDQRRTSPPLADQLSTLRRFARERKLVVAFVSQVDRSYDPAARPMPDLADVRLPNPLDLAVFDWTCFLHAGRLQVRTAA